MRVKRRIIASAELTPPPGRSAASVSKKDAVIDGDASLSYDPRTRRLHDRKQEDRQLKHQIRRKILMASSLAIIIGMSFFGIRFYSLSRVIVKNTNAAPVKLEQKLNTTAITSEGGSRVNILLLGVGDAGHAGADLSDTMQVLSIDTRTRDVAILGLPRDLYVKIDGVGFDKINSAHAHGEQHKPGSGPQLAKSTVSQVLGIPIDYFVRTDFSGLKKAIDTLGGVSIAVPETLRDNSYPCANNEGRSCGLLIPAGQTTMNGDLALKYTRCRKGNCGNDFGRARRQQAVLLAMRSKALSLSTLVNPAKLSDLIDVVGDDVRTDIGLEEMKKIYQITHDIDPTTVQTQVLDNNDNKLVETANLDGLSVVIPTIGQGEYANIQAFVRQLFFDGEIHRENAPLEIKNASGNPATGLKVCNLLKSYGYNVMGCSDITTQAHSELLDHSKGRKTYTLQYLQKRFSLKARTIQGATPATDPATGQATATISLVIGSDYKFSN